MTKPPRNGNDAIAAALGITPGAAAALRRRLPPATSEGFAELDATLRAEAAVADLEAIKSIDEDDIADIAEEDEPLEALKQEVDTRAERRLRAQLGAHASWAATENPSERTRPAREAFQARFERQVDPDGVLSPAERSRRAEHARKAFYAGLALKSAQARRKRKGGV